MEPVWKNYELRWLLFFAWKLFILVFYERCTILLEKATKIISNRTAYFQQKFISFEKPGQVW